MAHRNDNTAPRKVSPFHPLAPAATRLVDIIGRGPNTPPDIAATIMDPEGPFRSRGHGGPPRLYAMARLLDDIGTAPPWADRQERTVLEAAALAVARVKDMRARA